MEEEEEEGGSQGGAADEDDDLLLDLGFEAPPEEGTRCGPSTKPPCC